MDLLLGKKRGNGGNVVVVIVIIIGEPDVIIFLTTEGRHRHGVLLAIPFVEDGAASATLAVLARIDGAKTPVTTSTATDCSSWGHCLIY